MQNPYNDNQPQLEQAVPATARAQGDNSKETRAEEAALGERPALSDKSEESEIEFVRAQGQFTKIRMEDQARRDEPEEEKEMLPIETIEDSDLSNPFRGPSENGNAVVLEAALEQPPTASLLPPVQEQLPAQPLPVELPPPTKPPPLEQQPLAQQPPEASMAQAPNQDLGAGAEACEERKSNPEPIAFTTSPSSLKKRDRKKDPPPEVPPCPRLSFDLPDWEDSVIEELIFTKLKTAIPGESWIGQFASGGEEDQLVQLYRSSVHNRSSVIDYLEEFFLKVIVLPGTAPEADRCMSALCRVYAELFGKPFYAHLLQDTINLDEEKQPDKSGKIEFKIYHQHLYTAFKLTQQQQKVGILRAYRWLAAIVEASPLAFWKEVKKRVIKAMLTHTVVNAVAEIHDSAKSHPQLGLKLDCMRIAGKLQMVTASKNYGEYLQLIRNHLIQILMTDHSVVARIEAMKLVHFPTGSTPEDATALRLIATKSLDKSSKIRRILFQRLLFEKVPLSRFSEEDRIALVLNGLKEPELDIAELCRRYLSENLCALPGESPRFFANEKAAVDVDNFFEEEHSEHEIFQPSDPEGQISDARMVYKINQLQPLKNILRAMGIHRSANFKDPKLAEALLLLFQEVVFKVYDISVINNYLVSIVTTNFETYRTRNEFIQMYEDLIFLNFALHIKETQPPAIPSKEKQHSTIIYDKHVPSIEVYRDILKQVLMAFVTYCDMSKSEQSKQAQFKTPMKENLVLSCTLLLLRVMSYNIQIFKESPEESKIPAGELHRLLFEFVLSADFFAHNKRDSVDMKTPVPDFQEQAELKHLCLFTRDTDECMRLAMILARSLVGHKGFYSLMQTHILACEDRRNENLRIIFHQIRMVKSLLTIKPISNQFPLDSAGRPGRDETEEQLQEHPSPVVNQGVTIELEPVLTEQQAQADKLSVTELGQPMDKEGNQNSNSAPTSSGVQGSRGDAEDTEMKDQSSADGQEPEAVPVLDQAAEVQSKSPFDAGLGDAAQNSPSQEGHGPQPRQKETDEEIFEAIDPTHPRPTPQRVRQVKAGSEIEFDPNLDPPTALDLNDAVDTIEEQMSQPLDLNAEINSQEVTEVAEQCTSNVQAEELKDKEAEEAKQNRADQPDELKTSPEHEGSDHPHQAASKNPEKEAKAQILQEEEALSKLEAQQLSKISSMVLSRLMVNPDKFEGSEKKTVRKIQFRALECLGLLMVIDRSTFNANIEMLIGYIGNDQNDRKKSQLIYVALKTLFDCCLVHGFLLEQDEASQVQRANLRKLLMKQLRDLDFNIRLIATEGFCKLLMCERVNSPQDFISRLMLLKFERPHEINLAMETMQKASSKAAPDSLKDAKEKLAAHQSIRKSLDDFFEHFVRLSQERCNEFCLAMIQTVYYLLKGKGSKQIDPRFAQVNHFYLFGSMAELLTAEYNCRYAIFDLAQSGQSMHLTLLHLFGFIAVVEELNPSDEKLFISFFINALQFLEHSEFAGMAKDYCKFYEQVLNPLMKLLFYKAEEASDKEDQAQVRFFWVKLTEIYKKRQVELLPLEEESLDFWEQALKFVAKEMKDPKHQYERDKLRERITNYRSDIPEILDYCAMFFTQMKKQAEDFSEQRVALETEEEIQQRVEAERLSSVSGRSQRITVQESVDQRGTELNQIAEMSFSHHRREAKKAFKTVIDKRMLQEGKPILQPKEHREPAQNPEEKDVKTDECPSTPSAKRGRGQGRGVGMKRANPKPATQGSGSRRNSKRKV